MPTVTKEFITAGKAIFTIENPDNFRADWKKKNNEEPKPHYTFRVKFKAASAEFDEAYFVQLLTGPDNTANYSYIGLLNPATGEVRLTGNSKRGENSVEVQLLRRTLKRVWDGTADEIEKHGFKLHHEGRCGRCHRLLTTPESVERGIGPECVKYFPSLMTPKKATHGIPVAKVVDDVPSDAGAPDPQLEDEIERRLKKIPEGWVKNPETGRWEETPVVNDYEIVARFDMNKNFEQIDKATSESIAKQLVRDYKVSLGERYVVEYRRLK
jgi:hypothetical protein